MDDLAGEPLTPQLLVQEEIERHGVRALPLELVAVERLHRELQVLARELVLAALDDDADRLLLAQRRRHVGGIERRHGGGGLRHLLAEARAERSVVRLDLVAAELVGLGHEPQSLDVEFGRNGN